MGTRALIHVKDDEGENTLVTIYSQYDGYPTGLGADIKRVLGERTLVNGYNSPDTQCNGMGCAAAMLIAELKAGCGGVYIYKPDSADVWEEYVYTLSPFARFGGFRLVVQNPKNVIYDGPLGLFFPDFVEEAEE